jgi:hypothetical protein
MIIWKPFSWPCKYLAQQHVFLTVKCAADAAYEALDPLARPTVLAVELRDPVDVLEDVSDA